MKKQIINIVVFILPLIWGGRGAEAFAQSISPDVIITTGDYFFNATYSVAWTLGETMGETYSKPTDFLTQGFNQPDYGTLTITENKNSGIGIVAFPNPVMEELTISFSSSEGIYLVRIYDAIGNLFRVEPVAANVNSTYKIPFHDISEGVYLVQIINNNTFSKTSYTIIKVGK